MRAVLVVLLLASPFALLAPGSAAGVDGATVSAVNFAWTPDDVMVAPGEPVHFVLGAGSHTWELLDGSEPCELPCIKTFEPGIVDYRCGIHTSMTGRVRVGAPPTIVITTPAPHETLTGVATVEGTATHATHPIASVTLQLDLGPEVQATIVGSGTSVTWTAELPTANTANGLRLLDVNATTTTGVWNTLSQWVNVQNPPSLDVAIVSLRATPAALTANTIEFRVENLGNGPTGPFQALAEYRYHDTWRPIGTRAVTSIAYRSAADLSITWTTGTSPHVGSFPIRVTLDPEGALPDPDRANNVRQTTGGWVHAGLPGIILAEP